VQEVAQAVNFAASFGHVTMSIPDYSPPAFL